MHFYSSNVFPYCPAALGRLLTFLTWVTGGTVPWLGDVSADISFWGCDQTACLLGLGKKLGVSLHF